MKFNYSFFVVLLISGYLQGSQSKQQEVDPENQLASPLHVHDRISQHLEQAAEHRKEVLLWAAQTLTTSQMQPKITRGILKDVCRELPQVLLESPVDKNVGNKVTEISDRFRTVTCSSCYGCIPFWKNYANNQTRQEAIDLKNAINGSLQAINIQNGNSGVYVPPLYGAQEASAPIATAVYPDARFIEPNNQQKRYSEYE
jgi:hypothetical protein